MSEKNQTPEQNVNAENTGKKPARNSGGDKPKDTGNTTEKKKNWIVRGYERVKTGMSNHPFLTAFGGAAIGSGLTVGAGYGGKKLVEKHRAKKAQQPAYIPVQEDPNSLDPNR